MQFFVFVILCFDFSFPITTS